jgi:cytochrome d ubiquinol oxidase subunit II
MPEAIILVVLLAALILYAVLGGADFGAGVWEFNTAFQASDQDRRLIHNAIGPVWEANHVWLIFVVVLLANAFPVALAALSRALWLPLLLGLAGIVFRGASFAFRSYAVGDPAQQKLWGTVFALASTLAPFFLGAAVGAVASGKLAVTADGQFTGDPLHGWLSPLALYTAFYAVGMCAYLAAFFLVREAAHTGDEALVGVWRQRALAIGMWMGILAVVGVVLIWLEAPALWRGFLERGGVLVGLALGLGTASLVAMWRRWHRLAVAGAAGTVTSVLLGWGVAQYPLLVPPAVSIESRAPDNVLWLMVLCIAAGGLLLAPSLAWLMWLFKRTPERRRAS